MPAAQQRLHSHHSHSESPAPTLDSLEKLRSLQKRASLDVSHSESVQEQCKSLELSDENLRTIMKRMDESYEKGLSKDEWKTAAVKMLPSYVRSVPNGTESGDFLALDLGGTNFRVLLIRLDKTESEMTSKIFRVPETIMRGHGTKLFDHIAECLAKFMEEHDLMNREKLPLGFTFSFPCSQEGLTCARLVNWTKGFKAEGVEGKDVVTMLREACARRGDIDIDVVAVLNDTTGTMMACAFKENSCNIGVEGKDVVTMLREACARRGDIDIDVVAVLNDTTGTMMACAFKENSCNIGVICGTGSNACYMEKLDRIKKMEGEIDPAHDGLPDEMCINTEWGGFGDDGALAEFRTPYDETVDKNTINKGRQLFEKMVAGMYLGEIVRVILEHLAKEGHLFGGDYDAISQRGCFPTKFLSEIELEMQQDDEGLFAKTQQILEEIGVPMVTQTDCANVAYVCSVVSNRAAHMVAAGIASLLKRMKKPYVTVGVDGSVYRFHPTFPAVLDQKIDDLLANEDIEFQLMLSEDGSGRGAALVAAVATRMKRESEAHKLRKQLEQQL
uniref:Phosphotransferase n=1 Tax=Panagrolaimus sp. JU765 TaxID=591449 RepID=A0AC34PZC6_9BILA